MDRRGVILMGGNALLFRNSCKEKLYCKNGPLSLRKPLCLCSEVTVRMMRMACEIVCPVTLLLGEVVVGPGKVVPYKPFSLNHQGGMLPFGREMFERLAVLNQLRRTLAG